VCVYKSNKQTFINMQSSNSFERMVAIPEQEYNYLKSLQQVNNPLLQQVSTLSDEYARQAHIQDPQIRIQQQAETLHEMKKIKNDMRQRLIQSTPKPYQTRAQSLMNFIDGQIEVNDKGEIIDRDSQALEGSNIIDLIQHAVRDRRRNIQPSGWNEFKDRLKGVNVPQTLLNYETLDEMKSPLRIKSSPDTFKVSTTPSDHQSRSRTLKSEEVRSKKTIRRRGREVSAKASLERKRLHKSPKYYSKEKKYF